MLGTRVHKEDLWKIFGYFISNGCLSETLFLVLKKRKLSMGLIIIRLKIYYIYWINGIGSVYRLKTIDNRWDRFICVGIYQIYIWLKKKGCIQSHWYIP